MRELFFFAIYVLSHAPQQIDDEQVKRIEHIEDVLRKGAADKAALTVIHIDRDEGQTGYPPAAQHTAADDGLQYWLPTKDIEQQNEAIAATAVIGTQEDADNQQTYKSNGTPPPTKVGDGTEAEESQQQCEQDVLAGVMPCAGMHQIPRHLRNKGEDEQADTIAPAITGVHKALHQQEGKDGKCQTPH